MADRPTASVVEVAEAILMRTLRIGPDQALELLVLAARRENLLLHDVAERVVGLRLPD